MRKQSKMPFDVKRFDIYRKVPKDLTQPTTTGAVISLCCIAFICLMLLTELVWFISPDVRSELHVRIYIQFKSCTGLYLKRRHCSINCRSTMLTPRIGYRSESTYHCLSNSFSSSSSLSSLSSHVSFQARVQRE